MDREQVVFSLEHCKNSTLSNSCEECPYESKSVVLCENLIKDVIVLLKERETVSHALDILRAHGWREDGYPGEPGIVRCRDCKKGCLVAWEEMPPFVTCNGEDHGLDWFCADGEVK